MADLRPVYVAGDGDTKGPSSSSDSELPLFSGSTGKLLKGTGTVVTAAGRALLDDANNTEQRNTLGLDQVNNTSDLNKPLSTADIAALSGKQPNLGFTPVQQGTGVNQTGNVLKMGWSAEGRLKVTVDSTDMGNLSFDAAGEVTMFATIWPPSNFLNLDGSAISRATYARLFNAITYATVGNITSGSNSITGLTVNSTWFIGMPISGPGIPAGATVANATGTTITLSANATATTSGAAIRVCPFGVGDGSTTFTLPDMRGNVPKGWAIGAGTDAARVFGSYQADGVVSHVHGVNDPSHSHYYSAAAYGTQMMGGGYNNYANWVGGYVGASVTGITIQAAGIAENRVRSLAFMFCIRY